VITDGASQVVLVRRIGFWLVIEVDQMLCVNAPARWKTGWLGARREELEPRFRAARLRTIIYRVIRDHSAT
jgi:hypothetical protein